MKRYVKAQRFTEGSFGGDAPDRSDNPINLYWYSDDGRLEVNGDPIGSIEQLYVDAHGVPFNCYVKVERYSGNRHSFNIKTRTLGKYSMDAITDVLGDLDIRAFDMVEDDEEPGSYSPDELSVSARFSLSDSSDYLKPLIDALNGFIKSEIVPNVAEGSSMDIIVDGSITVPAFATSMEVEDIDGYDRLIRIEFDYDKTIKATLEHAAWNKA